MAADLSNGSIATFHTFGLNVSRAGEEVHVLLHLHGGKAFNIAMPRLLARALADALNKVTGADGREDPAT